MGEIERFIIYSLLAMLVVATFSKRRRIQAQGKPEEATFRKLTIVDGKGEKRVEIGHIGVQLYDEEGKPRAVLDVSKDGPRLHLYNEWGELRAVLDVTSIGSRLALYDKKGRAGLTVDKDGPEFYLIDKNGRAVLGVDKDGRRLALKDAKGQRSTVLVALKERPWLNESKDGPRLHLYDEADKLRAVLGSISLRISETGMVIKRSPSSLVLFDEDGKVIWSSPED